MPPKRGALNWPIGYHAILVGIRSETQTVETVYLRNDGGMNAGGRVHFPGPDRTALGEAMTAFGLTTFRWFPASETGRAKAYAELLAVQLRSHDTAPDEG
jgi:hypothetical protein